MFEETVMSGIDCPKIALSMKVAEEAVDLGHTQIYKEINSGRLKTYKVGRRRYTTPEWLREWQQLMASRGDV